MAHNVLTYLDGHSREDNPFNQRAFAHEDPDIDIVHALGVIGSIRWPTTSERNITWTIGPGTYGGADNVSPLVDDLLGISGYGDWLKNTREWSTIWPPTGTNYSGEMPYPGHSYTEAELTNIIKADIAEAFSLWEAVADITFEYIAPDPNNLADFIIWAGEDGLGPNLSEGNVLGHVDQFGEKAHLVLGSSHLESMEMTSPKAGDVHMHNSFRWYSKALDLLAPESSTYPNALGADGQTYRRNSLQPDPLGYDFISVLTHEIGHALGMGHVDQPSTSEPGAYVGENWANQVMYRFIAGNPLIHGYPASFSQPLAYGYSHYGSGHAIDQKQLGWGDIDGIQAIYGAKPGWVDPTDGFTVTDDSYSLDLNSTYSMGGNVLTNDNIMSVFGYIGLPDSGLYFDEHPGGIVVQFVMQGTVTDSVIKQSGIVISQDQNWYDQFAPDPTIFTTIPGLYGTLIMYSTGVFGYAVVSSPASAVSETFTYMMTSKQTLVLVGNKAFYREDALPFEAVGTLTINITPDGGGGTPPPGISLLGIDSHLGNWDTSPSVIKFSDYTLGSESLPSVKKNTDILTLSESKQLKEFSDPSNSDVVNIELTSTRVISITENVTSKSLPIPPLDGTTITDNFDIGLNFNHTIQSDSGHLPYFKYSKWKDGVQDGNYLQLDMSVPINVAAWNLNFNYSYSLGDENLTNKIRIDIEDFATGSMIQSDYLVSFYACKYAYDITYTQMERGYWGIPGYTYAVWGNIGKHLYNTQTDWVCGMNAGPDYQSVQGVSYYDHNTNFDWCHGYSSRGTYNNKMKYTGIWGLTDPSGTAAQQYCFDPTASYVTDYCEITGTCVSCKVDCPAWAQYSTSVPTNEQEGGAPWGDDGPCIKGIDYHYMGSPPTFGVSFSVGGTCFSNTNTVIQSYCTFGANGNLTGSSSTVPCILCVIAPPSGDPIGTHSCQEATCSHKDFGVDESSLVWEYVNGITLQPNYHTSPNPPCLDPNTHSFSSLQLPSSSTPTSLKDWFDSSQPLYTAWGASQGNVAQYLDATLLTSLFPSSSCSRSYYDSPMTSYSNNCKMRENVWSCVACDGTDWDKAVIRVNNLWIANPSGSACTNSGSGGSVLSDQATTITINTLTDLNNSVPGMATLRNIPTYNFPNLGPEATDLFTYRLNTGYVTNLYADLLPLHLSNVDLNSIARGTEGNKYVLNNSVSISITSAESSNNSNC